MNIYDMNEVSRLLTPGEIQHALQIYKTDPVAWREKFVAVMPRERLGDVDVNQLLDTLGDYLARVPR
jgi:hypothetical protein